MGIDEYSGVEMGGEDHLRYDGVMQATSAGRTVVVPKWGLLDPFPKTGDGDVRNLRKWSVFYLEVLGGLWKGGA